jgi:uncharacterized protein
MSQEADILRSYKTVAVVGLSADESRPSFRVSRYMQEHGYKIIPVNPSEHEVLGEHCYATLAEIPVPVEIVDVFRRSEFCADVAHDAIAVGAKALWLQEGIVSEEARTIAEAAGLDYVEDACAMVVHRNELGSLPFPPI